MITQLDWLEIQLLIGFVGDEKTVDQVYSLIWTATQSPAMFSSRVSVRSVYRCVDRLLAKGMIERVTSKKPFEFRSTKKGANTAMWNVAALLTIDSTATQSIIGRIEWASEACYGATDISHDPAWIDEWIDD